MEGKLNPESTFVHSPLSSYHHSQHPSMELSESSEDAEGSDVSDMVIENASKFAGLSRERRKSGGSDYHPPSESNSASESESASPSRSSDEEYSERSTPQKRAIPRIQMSDEDSETTEGTSSRSRSVSTQPFLGHERLKESPIVRKSPLNVSYRSSTATNDTTTMRGYRYSMLPSRSAAMNVSYSRYLEEESDSDEDVYPRAGGRGGKGRGRKRAKDSESEFEMSVGESEASMSEDPSLSGESSDEGYRPPKRKGRRKVGVHFTGNLIGMTFPP